MTPDPQTTRENHVTTRRRGKWTEVTLNASPGLTGDQARRAGRLVIRGARESIAAKRSAGFIIKLGLTTGVLTMRCWYVLLDHYLARVESGDAEGSIWSTIVPDWRADAYLAALQAIVDERTTT